MKIIREYFKLIGNALIGIAFGFAFFYLILNFYHYGEIRRSIVFQGSNDTTIKNIDSKLEKITENINSVKKLNPNISSSEFQKVKNRFNTCVNNINNEEYLEIKNKNEINIKDVYKLRDSFEDSVASKCLVSEFIYLIDENNKNNFLVENNQEMYSLLLKDLINSTEYVKGDLYNNSSYYFSTEISLINGKNLTKASFYQVLNSYDKSVTFLLNLSNRFKELNMEVQ